MCKVVLHYDLVLSWNLLNVSLFKEIVVSMHAIELEFTLVLSIRDYLSNTVIVWNVQSAQTVVQNTISFISQSSSTNIKL